MLYYEVFSRKGKKSPENEDSYFIPNPDLDLCHTEKLKEMGLLFILCDGMGGHQAGEVASRLSCDWLSAAYYNSQPTLPLQSHLSELILDINERLFHLGREQENCSGLGSTMVSLLIKNDMAYICSIGDSRLYLFDFKKFQQLTEDQSPLWDLYKSNLISKDDMIIHPFKNLLKEAVGLRRDPIINNYCLKVPDKFLFLICSDGLTDVATDSDIEARIKVSESLQDTFEKLYQLSQDKGSRDDVTMILISNYLQ